MPYTDAQKRATAKYNAKAYDRIEIKVKKGQKEIIQKHAEEQGKSLNSYIVDLIESDMQDDKSYPQMKSRSRQQEPPPGGPPGGGWGF